MKPIKLTQQQQDQILHIAQSTFPDNNTIVLETFEESSFLVITTKDEAKTKLHWLEFIVMVAPRKLISNYIEDYELFELLDELDSKARVLA